jgi:hypothetical protein
MKILKPSELNYLNYLLLALTYLTEESEKCDIPTLVNHCSENTFEGRIVDYKNIVGIAKLLGFVELNDGVVSISDVGKKFAKGNSDNSFEISIEQKKIFSEVVVFSGKWESVSRRFFSSSFIPNHEDFTFVLTVPKNELPSELKYILDVFLTLDIIECTGSRFQVSNKYVKHVRNLRAATNQNITQEELNIMLENKRRAGFRAEELVFHYEKNRLLKNGLLAEAERVLRISELDVAAGYDIKSFSGNQSELLYSRFIEVKSSQFNYINFHWSANEIDVAERLGEKYWIYYIYDFNKKTDLNNIKLIKIQNPYKEIMDGNKGYSVSIREYLVRKEIFQSSPLSTND